MTQPVPEESNEAYDLDQAPPGEHTSELPDEDDHDGPGPVAEENAGTTLDQPSQ